MTDTEKKTSLIDATISWQELQLQLLEAGGELSPEIETMLANVQQTMMTKLDSYDYLMERAKAEEKFFKAKSDEYFAAAQRCAAFSDRMKQTIKTAMQMGDIKSLEGKEVRFTLSDAAPKIEITNEAIIPEEYMTTKTVTTRLLFREHAMAQLKSGVEIPGLALTPVKTLRRTISRGLK